VRKKKKEEEEGKKKKPQGKNILSTSATQGGHNKETVRPGCWLL